MRNMIRKFFGIEALEDRTATLERQNRELSKILDDKIAELDRLTRKDLDVGFRGNNTVVLTGVYRGRGYVQFYDVPQDHFIALVEEFRHRRKGNLVRHVDAPPSFGGAFNIT